VNASNKRRPWGVVLPGVWCGIAVSAVLLIAALMGSPDWRAAVGGARLGREQAPLGWALLGQGIEDSIASSLMSGSGNGGSGRGGRSRGTKTATRMTPMTTVGKHLAATVRAKEGALVGAVQVACS
jgi:hypothetical protein